LPNDKSKSLAATPLNSLSHWKCSTGPCLPLLLRPATATVRSRHNLLATNDAAAERNRGASLRRAAVLNVLSAPTGSGKTALWKQLAPVASGPGGVDRGDPATDKDDAHSVLRAAGARPCRSMTGDLLSSGAAMVGRAFESTRAPGQWSCCWFENVRQSVCPTAFDLEASSCGLVCSRSTEGEINALKYPARSNPPDVVWIKQGRYRRSGGLRSRRGPNANLAGVAPAGADLRSLGLQSFGVGLERL